MFLAIKKVCFVQGIFLTGVCLVVMFETWESKAHPNLPPNMGGGIFGSGSLVELFVQKTEKKKIDSSAVLTLNIYGNLGHPISKDFQEGEPLGPGGKSSGNYNAFLYGMSATGVPGSPAANSKIQYGEFGYIPLWQPNSFSGQIEYRFIPNLLGRASFGCSLELNGANAGTNDVLFALGELLCTWSPRSVQGLDISFGRLHWMGSYAAIFDQLPLEQFAFDGAIASYVTDLSKNVRFNVKLGFGSRFYGNIVNYQDYNGFQQIYHQKITDTWKRLHCLGSCNATINNNFSIKLIGGFQKVPEYTSVITKENTAYKYNKTIDESYGWHAGLELNCIIARTEQTVTLAYGMDNVQLGWSAPWYTDKKKTILMSEVSPEKSEFGQHDFSRKGSSLLHSTWWMNFRRGRLKGSMGVWGGYSIPDDREVLYIFESRDNTKEFGSVFDTISVKAIPTSFIKGALDFSNRVVGPLHLGVRCDIFNFRNPYAHSNTLEFERSWNFFYTYSKAHPSKWDYEAVNCRIITPYCIVNIANIFYVKGAYAFAQYDKKVLRQGRNALYHRNCILSMRLDWSFFKKKKL